VKRVHYLAGAALAPAAMGLAIPAGAHAATTGAADTGATHTGGKTVSLRHSGIRLARGSIADASSAGASSAGASSQSPGTAAAGCHGNTNRKLGRVGNVKGQLWYANNFDDSDTCIGTIDASLYFAHTYCKSAGVSVVTYPVGGGPVTRKATVCGTKGQWTRHAFGIHEEFSHLPAVSGVAIDIWSQYGGPTGTEVGS
jgi:hypothetical protein